MSVTGCEPIIRIIWANNGSQEEKIGGSGLIMAILGGAVLTVFQGQVSDLTQNIRLAYLVPLVCFGVIAYYGAVACRKDLAVSNKIIE